MTLHLRQARVYEILDAIVAKHGAAVWVVRVPPEKLPTLKGTLWYMYPLEPSDWKAPLLGDLNLPIPGRTAP